MTSIPDYVLNYSPRTWIVYRIEHGTTDRPKAGRDEILRGCGSTSKMATHLGDNPHRFYIDAELIMAECDPIAGGGDPKRLTQEWTAPD